MKLFSHKKNPSLFSRVFHYSLFLIPYSLFIFFILSFIFPKPVYADYCGPCYCVNIQDGNNLCIKNVSPGVTCWVNPGLITPYGPSTSPEQALAKLKRAPGRCSCRKGMFEITNLSPVIAVPGDPPPRSGRGWSYCGEIFDFSVIEAQGKEPTHDFVVPFLNIKIPGLTLVGEGGTPGEMKQLRTTCASCSKKGYEDKPADCPEADCATWNYSIPWIGQYLAAVYRWLVFAACILAVIMIIVAGIKIIFSAGSAPAIKNAWGGLFSALLGLVFLLIAYPLFSFVNFKIVELPTINIGSVAREQPKESDIPPDTYPSSSSDPEMTTVKVKVWNKSGQKEEENIIVNKVIANEVKVIFDQILSLDENNSNRTPIESVNGWYLGRPSSKHTVGLAIDINPTQNFYYECNFCYNSDLDKGGCETSTSSENHTKCAWDVDDNMCREAKRCCDIKSEDACLKMNTGGTEWCGWDEDNQKCMIISVATREKIINGNKEEVSIASVVKFSYWKPNNNNLSGWKIYNSSDPTSQADPLSLDKESNIVKTFVNYGWCWGGTWKYMKDYMHFSKAVSSSNDSRYKREECHYDEDPESNCPGQ